MFRNITVWDQRFQYAIFVSTELQSSWQCPHQQELKVWTEMIYKSAAVDTLPEG